MKQLQSNFTTSEQSKKLLELGVPRWSADEYRDQKGYRYSLEGILDVELFFQNFPDNIPCWSVGRLIEIIKICSIRSEPILKILRFIDNTDDIVGFIIHYLGYETQIGRIDFSKLEE